ncbi:MAG: 3-hydroxyacyl-CoA dehydrogenase family protein [Deltaproteobacteria bacterium]|nr:3-hydroxyacyl-CoA dehydrogenase family protein [Deltaproteobacteria bacterium]
MDVSRICIVGAGVMGPGIAQTFAQAGYRVTINDIQENILNRALGIAEKNLKKAAERGKIDDKEVRPTLERITPVLDFNQAVSDVDMVVEAVPEDMGLKQKVFAQLDMVCPKRTILASNTSALSPTEIASATNRPEKVVGMHFFNPPHIMKLVEVTRGLLTSDDTSETVYQIARKIGKEPVRINEMPGGVASRLNVLLNNEAFNMLQEGVASAEDIDKSLKFGLNYPMGTFEIVDLVGLDVRLSVLETLHKGLGEKYRPSPLLVKYVKAGRLGKKVGRGVYEYTADGKRKQEEVS